MNRKIETKLNTKKAKELYKVITLLSNEKEVANFLRDLLTFEELDEAIRRFTVAKMLIENKTFRVIEKTTGMSSTTIARINNWLNHGTGGYRLALKDILKDKS